MIIKPQSKIKSKDNGLYLVSTPIGNLKDITLRALEILKKSDVILCEDTRVSKKLLDRYEIKSKLISNHKFNETKNLNKIIDLLKLGKIISLISDAGTPSISDPGSILVNECIKNNIKIIPIPGASAVVTAVSISGFSEKFFFYGFLPNKKKELIRDLKKFSKLDESFVFFVSPKKINRIIPFLKANFIEKSELKIGKYKLDLNSRELISRKNVLKLTEKETNIIIYLSKSNYAVGVDQLQSEVWQYHLNLETHTVETHIYSLRKKILKIFDDNNFIISKKNGYQIN